MKPQLKKFSFPYKTGILIFSLLLLLIPFLILGLIDFHTLQTNPMIYKLLLLFSTLLSAIGFIYCSLGYHFQILRGDELKLRIHLEALNISFTTSLVFLFALIFVFINFFPTQLNYLLIYLTIIGIIAYELGVIFVNRKYK
ncbi:MAG: hypothetical protein ACOYU5_01110 [Stygiobacter sp.]